jgi:thiamine transporter
MSKAKMLTVCAMCIALAFALNQVALFRMPQGGSITPFSMFFIALAGYWLGPFWGILTGVSMGLLDYATGGYSIHIASMLLDYPVAFGLIGIAGFFRKMRFGLQIGFIVGVLGRFASVWLSGYLFWLEAAPGSMIGSAIYNGTYIVPELLATLVIISLPAMVHAIDNVTRSVVSPAVYAQMAAKSKGSFSSAARIVTGAVMGAIGGFAFVLVSHLQRVENLSIAQITSDAVLFEVAPRADRIYRLVAGNTSQMFALQTVGVIFIAIAIALLFSTLTTKSEV